MKALKEAIELLKFFKDRKNTKITTMIKVQSCIAELEALQQRSCDGCKYGEIDKFEQYRVTCRNKLALFNQMINADFCCNRYEAKEQ